MQLPQVCSQLDSYFAGFSFADVSNNGLQVEASQEIKTVAFAVDACQATFAGAVAAGAELLVVHHGISWGSGTRYFSGLTGRRLSYLYRHGLSLYACHLPMDAHRDYGHNAILAKMLNLKEQEQFYEYDGAPIGMTGTLPERVKLETLAQKIEGLLSTECKIFPVPEQGLIRRVGIVCGGGDSAVEDCEKLGLDCLITGEMKHQTYHVARECQVAVITGGHYATETLGVKAIMGKLQNDLQLECHYLHVPTGM